MTESGDAEGIHRAARGPLRSRVSPQPLAADLRSADDRDLPSRTDALAGALSQVVGGPVGRHALIGRARFLTPLRVMLAIAVVFLALGYTTKAACLVTTGAGTADQKVANWQNQRAYYELCYSDTVPLYTAELLNLGKFPYKSSWIETDSKGRPQVQFDGNIAVRYMEYPVITGVYQYMSMALAKTYSALSKLVPLPSIAEVVMFFNISALGLALAWFATVWSTAKLAGRRIWDAALVAGSPIVIFQIFTNFDALATAFAVGAILAWSRRRPVLAGALIGLGVAAKLYPILLLIPLAILGLRSGRLREVGKTAAAAVVAWLLVNLPVMVMFPRGWSEFFRLNARRGDDMDSLYNVVKSFTGWQGFDTGLGLWQPPVILNGVVMVLFVLCCAGIAYVALTAELSAAARAGGVSGRRPVPVDEQSVEPAVLPVAGAAGGAGVAAPPHTAGVDDDRRTGVGAADAVLVRRAEPRTARTVVHRHRSAARYRSDRVVRVGDSADLPPRAGPRAQSRTGRRPVGRGVRRCARPPTRLAAEMVAAGEQRSGDQRSRRGRRGLSSTREDGNARTCSCWRVPSSHWRPAAAKRRAAARRARRRRQARRPTRAPRRCAPAHWCWRPPGCSTE